MVYSRQDIFYGSLFFVMDAQIAIIGARTEGSLQIALNGPMLTHMEPFLLS